YGTAHLDADPLRELVDLEEVELCGGAGCLDADVGRDDPAAAAALVLPARADDEGVCGVPARAVAGRDQSARGRPHHSAGVTSQRLGRGRDGQILHERVEVREGLRGSGRLHAVGELLDLQTALTGGDAQLLD